MPGVPRPQLEDEAYSPEAALEQVEVHATRPALPVIARVIRLRPELQMRGVHAEPVMQRCLMTRSLLAIWCVRMQWINL